jgi:hypothetical protein
MPNSQISSETFSAAVTATGGAVVVSEYIETGPVAVAVIFELLPPVRLLRLFCRRRGD